ncbi:TNF receptor-associated factor 2 isoform X1 [Anopheles stephensi]|uniref:TNF receptor-associated factor 2 isoform X1 n=2 Tax=Anopheles stephensi TaxID=30069 RepID=UPI0009B4F6D2|nr:TNF receptor-associated factor 2 isoform X1 [Anopheles stephensi]
MAETAKGRLKFSQTSCYLCSAWLDDSDVEEHLRTCRQQRTVCPNSCGTIVAFKDLQLHRNTCPNGYGAQMEDESTFSSGQDPSTSTGNESEPVLQQNEALTLGQVLTSLENELKCMKLVMAEHSNYKHYVHTELARLSKYFDVSQKWTTKVYDSIVSLNKLCYQEKIQRTLELTAVQQKLLSNEIWNLDIGNRFDRVEEALFFLNQKDTPEAGDNDRTDATAAEPSGLQNVSPNDEDDTTTDDALTSTISKLKLDVAAQTASEPLQATTSNMASQAVSTSQLVQQVIEEFKVQYANTNVEVKDIKVRLFEFEERLQALEKLIERYRRETYHTKQRSEELQHNLMWANGRNNLASDNGHVIWRIDNFAQKLQDSKALESMIKGPIFTNQPYGYMLQMEASPYGIGTWRGRNLIAGLTVIPGPYDDLLEWPCRLTATLILRDQPEKREDARNVCKPIVAKVKGQRDPNQHYVYISHEILFANNYLNKDTIFLELIITSEEGKSTI